jgi:hypothetical protein
MAWAAEGMLRLPGGLGTPGRWSGPTLLAGNAAAMAGIVRLAIAGHAPGGTLPALTLAAFGCGVGGTLSSGPPATRRPPPGQRWGFSTPGAQSS